LDIHQFKFPKSHRAINFSKLVDEPLLKIITSFRKAPFTTGVMAYSHPVVPEQM